MAEAYSTDTRQKILQQFAIKSSTKIAK